MIRHIIGWFDPRTGRTGYYSKTYPTKAEARQDRPRRNRQHEDRAHGIVSRTGGDDGH